MPFSRRLLLLAALSTLVVLGVPRLLKSELLPWAQANQVLDELDSANQRAQKLERCSTVINWRYEAKNCVIHLLLTEELSLLETVAWFHRLNKQPAECNLSLISPWAGSEEEQARQQVIAWLRAACANPSNNERSNRLEAELYRVFSQPGALALPEPPELPGLTPCPELEAL